jgi:hypothetical protein
MPSASRATFNSGTLISPPLQGIGAMAEVLESRHGAYAAGIAEFFSLYHGQKGDADRAGAWSNVAEFVRARERERLEEN